MMLLRVLSTVLALATTQSGQPMRVEVIPGPLQSSECQFVGDDMMLQILQGRTVILSEHYCSAYGKGSAKLVTDNRGRTFVLLDYSEGHGTHSSTDYLRVDELIKSVLYNRGRLLRREPIGPFADLIYDYSLERLPAGGLRIAGVSRAEGKRDKGLDLDIDAKQRQTVLTIR